MFGIPKFGVEGKRATALDSGPKAQESVEEQVKKLMAEVQRTLDSYESFFVTFAEDISLKFVAGEAFFIDLKNGVVNLDIRWFFEQGYGKEQIIWAVFHELSHFRDLAKDPKRMMENFEYIKRKSKKTALAITARAKEVGQVSSTAAAERVAYDIHHTFFNIFDDIYVNNLVSERAPKYEPKTAGGKVVKDLYREKLFPGTDYQSSPRHLQFLYSLLREEMVPDEQVQVSPEMYDLLENTRIIHEKRKYSLKEFIRVFLKPQSKNDTRAGERYKLLQKHIEPIYEKLVAQDLADWKPSEEQEQNQQQEQEPSDSNESEASDTQDESGGTGGTGGKPRPNEQPFEKEYEDFKKRHIDQMDDAEFEKFTKEEVVKEAGKSAEEAAAKAQEKMDAEWCKENNVTSEQLRKFRDIEREISPHLSDLTALWRRIIHGSGRRIERVMKTGFRRGTDLDVGRAVQQWPEIQSGHMDDATIMRRMSVEERPVKKPELIRVRILADSSASMNSTKLAAQDKAIALVLSSLDEFNTYLNQSRSDTGSSLKVETELWSFETGTRKLKPTGANDPLWNERAAMIRSVGLIDGRGGSTEDARALETVGKSISAQDREAIRAGSILEIVFVMTDGGSANAIATRGEVEKLTKDGVVARAFQIGTVDEYEQSSFETAWNEGRTERFGAIVGEQVGNLVPAVAEVLKKHLSDVEL